MGTVETAVNCCRVCVHLSDRTQDLYKTIYNNLSLAKILEYCLHRPLNHTDNLPHTICSECHANLISTYEFHMLCESSERVLLERLASIDTAQEFSSIKHDIECDASIADVKNLADSCKSELMINQEPIEIQEPRHSGQTSQDSMVESLECKEQFARESQDQGDWGQPYACKVCKTRFVHYSTWARHCLRHTKTIYDCEYCDQSFPTTANIKDHILRKHYNDTKIYRCDQCPTEFPLRILFLGHKERHRDASKKLNELKLLERKHRTELTFECFECKETFDQFNNLKAHMVPHRREKSKSTKETEDTTRKNVCDVCNKSFTQPYSLKVHKRLHTGERPYQCDICPERFHLLKRLKHHKLSHTGERPYLCSECGKSFTSTMTLRKHQLRHGPVKPFACDLCPSRFNSNSSLATHKVVHTREKSYACDICEKSFGTRIGWRAHKRIHERQGRSYQCEMCPKIFYSKQVLNRHMFTHTGEKPHTCSYCPKSFSQSGDLVKHLRSHVGPNTYRCHCGQSFRLQAELRTHSFTHYNQQEQESQKTEQPQ